MDPKEILRRPYARRLTPQEDGRFLATIQEFPGCIADGESPDEALRNLEAAAESWIEASMELGREIPEPIDMQGFSGKVALRIPRGLHKQAAEMALSEGTSINHLLTTAIASYFGGKQALRHLVVKYTQKNLILHLHQGVSFQRSAYTMGQSESPFQIPRTIKPQVLKATMESGEHG